MAIDAVQRIEQALHQALSGTDDAGCPPKLAAAMRHAVFPGGARIRPQLTLAVARACGDHDPALADAAAAAIELLHCASLVHDDLPCFDDAPLRRGKPSVHAAFGERIAVLVGDALIVSAFQGLAEAAASGRVLAPQRLPALLALIGRRVGTPAGIVAGQAWECEPFVAVPAYQRAKTGSLFAACTEAGAIAGSTPGADGSVPGAARWQDFGLCLGEAYQVADDIRDVALGSAALGKPQGQDALLARPSSATEMGLQGAIRHFDHLLARAVDAIPACAGAGALRALVRAESERLVPKATLRDLALAA